MPGFILRAETVAAHREWSIKNFGTRDERGPVGPLKHLSKEALEAAEAPKDIMEYADCQFLLLDSLYRAGFTCEQLNDAMDAKQEILNRRTYGRGKADEPSEHVRSEHDEVIACVAIKSDDNSPCYLPKPARHGDVIMHMVKLGHETPITGDQGFMTSHGRFVDRIEACEIARKAGQLIRKTGPDHILFSEDLW